MVGSFGTLRSVHWHLVTDVSEQPVGPIFEGEAVKRMDCLALKVGNHRLPRNFGI